MNTFKLYLTLSQISGFIGIGMVLGANLSEGTNSTPLWIGGILIFAGAILLGMSISTRSQDSANSTEAPEESTKK